MFNCKKLWCFGMNVGICVDFEVAYECRESGLKIECVCVCVRVWGRGGDEGRDGVSANGCTEKSCYERMLQVFAMASVEYFRRTELESATDRETDIEISSRRVE